MLKWVDKLPLEVAQWIPEEYFGYGQQDLSSLYLKKDNLYTIKYKCGWGWLRLADLSQFLRKCLSEDKKIARVINVAETGLFTRDLYISVIPYKNLKLINFISYLNSCLSKFSKQSIAQKIFVFPYCHYADIVEGDLISMKKKEKEEKGLPAWAEDLALIGGLTAIGIVAVKTLIEKVRF